jgi:hypothetical protein
MESKEENLSTNDELQLLPDSGSSVGDVSISIDLELEKGSNDSENKTSEELGEIAKARSEEQGREKLVENRSPDSVDDSKLSQDLLNDSDQDNVSSKPGAKQTNRV